MAENLKDLLAEHGDVSADELKHFGVKGMRWGVRRSDAELARAAIARGVKRDPDADGDGKISRKERKSANSDAKVSEDSAKQMAKMKPGTVVTLESDQGNFKSMVKKQDGSWVDTELSPSADKVLASTKATHKDMTTEQLREAIAFQKAVDEYNSLFTKQILEKHGLERSQVELDKNKLELAIKNVDYKTKLYQMRAAKPSKIKKVAAFTTQVGVVFASLASVNKATNGAVFIHLNKTMFKNSKFKLPITPPENKKKKGK